jgi:hypothetical protein
MESTECKISNQRPARQIFKMIEVHIVTVALAGENLFSAFSAHLYSTALSHRIFTSLSAHVT